MRKYFFIILLVHFVFIMNTQAVQADKKEKTDSKSQKSSPVSLDQLVHRLIEKNFDVRLAALHYLMATSDKDQFKAKYGFYFKGDASTAYSESPEYGRNLLFEGAKQRQHNINAFIAKSFSTGTSVAVGATTTYTNSGVDGAAIAASLSQNPATAGFAPLFSGMVQPPLYSSSLVVEVRQSLLRNFLGRNERAMSKMLDNVSEQKKLMTMQILSGLIVEALVYYWNLAVLEETLNVLTEQLKSTQQVREMTARKQRLGLAENVELMQWDSLIQMYKNQILLAEKNLRDGRRKLLQAVQLPEDTVIETSTALSKNKQEFQYQELFQKALARRADYQSARLSMETAQLALGNAKNEMYPTLELILRGQSKGRQEGFASSYSDVPSVNYPSYYVGIAMTAPLYNTGLTEKIRDHTIQFEQAKTQYNRLRDDIAKEIIGLIDEVNTMYSVYNGAVKSEAIALNYYRGILTRFRQGRFNSIVVKEALDNYIKMRLEKMRILIGYNVALLRLDFAQNQVMERFGLSKVIVENYLDNHFKKK